MAKVIGIDAQVDAALEGDSKATPGTMWPMPSFAKSSRERTGAAGLRPMHCLLDLPQVRCR